jgi:hypothetical protein
MRSAFERVKTVHDLDRAVTVVALYRGMYRLPVNVDQASDVDKNKSKHARVR